MNKIILTGRLTRSAEIKTYPNTSIATFTLASNKKLKNKDEVLFIDCKAFGRVADIIDEYLTKGDKILIEGRLVLEKWEDKEGFTKQKYVIAVEGLEMLSTRNNPNNESENPYLAPDSKKQSVKSVKEATKSYKTIDINNEIESDEIPF